MGTVLITGGGGVIGRALAARHRERGDRVLTTCRSPAASRAAAAGSLDVTDAVAVRALIATLRPDVIHHLAGDTIPRGYVDAYRVHVDGTRNVLSAVLAVSPATAVVVASSERVYRGGGDRPLREDDALTTEGAYGATKAQADALARRWARERGLRTAALRIGHVYGPRDGVASRLVPSLLAAIDGRCELRLRGDGSSCHDFVWAGDVADAFTATAQALHSGGRATGAAINVGSGTPVSVLELVACAQELVAEPIAVRTGCRPVPPRDRSRVLDVARAAELIGWIPRTPLESGLARLLPHAAGAARPFPAPALGAN